MNFRYIIPLLFSLTNHNHAKKTLQMVNLVYRHGARSPLAFYPTDPYQESHWPDGRGRLTQYGMRLEYELGKFFKERYITNTSFVNRTYHHNDIYVRSSDKDRCIQSAQAQLAGMYPPQGYQIWNTDIPWQPIAIHTVPKDEDIELRSHSVPCARLKQIWQEKRSGPVYKRKLRDSKELLNTISKYSKMKVDLENVYQVTDPVKCEKAEGLKIPKWINDIWEKASELEDWWHVFFFSGNDEVGRLLGGELLGKMNENMRRFSEKKVGTKLNVWSGHDTSLLSLCAALGFKCHLPSYAASIMLELYHTPNHGYSVEIIYRKNYTNAIERLKIKGCDYSCPLETFLKLTSVRTTMDRKKLCSVTLLDANKPIMYLTIGFLFMFMVAVVIFYMIKSSSVMRSKFIYHSPVVADDDLLFKNNKENY